MATLAKAITRCLDATAVVSRVSRRPNTWISCTCGSSMASKLQLGVHLHWGVCNSHCPEIIICKSTSLLGDGKEVWVFSPICPGNSERVEGWSYGNWQHLQFPASTAPAHGSQLSVNSSFTEFVALFWPP